MPVLISLLRAVNLAARNRVPMEGLRELYHSLGFDDVQSYVQSGNLVFRTNQRDLRKLADRIEGAIADQFGVETSVILRTVPELEQIVARNPFAARPDVAPNKLLVTFFAHDPREEACTSLASLKPETEELHLRGRELFIYFPTGAGRSKLTAAKIDKLAGCAGTARNWNTVLKLLEMGQRLSVRK